MYSFMKQGGLEVKLRTFLTVPVLNSRFIALATLIADKQAPGTQTIIGGPPKFRCEVENPAHVKSQPPLIRFATDSPDNIFFLRNVLKQAIIFPLTSSFSLV